MQAILIKANMFYLFGVKFNSKLCPLRNTVATMDEPFQAKLTQQLLACPEISEAIIIPTCNRLEIIIFCQPHQSICTFIIGWINSFSQDNYEAFLKKNSYQLSERAAIQHIIKTAAGLDSMITGETQVFGQIKKSFAIAKNADGIGKTFKQLFPRIFHAAKNIRTETQLEQQTTTLGGLVRSVLDKKQIQSILLIGYGEVIQSIVPYLKAWNVSIATRSSAIAEPPQDGILLLNINDAIEKLEQFDCIISATNHKAAIIKAEHFKTQPSKPITLIDLAIPYDIDPTVSTLNHITLYNLDQIQQKATLHKTQQKEVIKRAHALVESHSDWIIDLNSLDQANEDIKALRKKIDIIHNQQLSQALQSLKNGDDPETVLRQHLRLLSNKILHKPTINLKKAARKEQKHILELAKTLFEVEGEC